MSGSTKVHLVLSDDWELRGDGSGNMRAIQFATLRRLRRVYEREGVVGTFNVEVMQQLAHLRLGGRHPRLVQLAREWEEVVREAYRAGHDVQLHVHPQWLEAEYDPAAGWRLGMAWSVTEYPAETFREMVAQCRDYLESLLRPLDPGYRCTAFRSGSWSLAPSDHVLEVLAEAGIVFDTSIAHGLVYDTPHVRLDYRRVEEPFLPFYPVMSDARRVASSPQPIVCIPTHSFLPSRGTAARVGERIARLARRAGVPGWSLAGARYLPPNAVPIEDAGYSRSYGREVWGPSSPELAPTRQVSDLSTLNFVEMREMIDDIVRRAAESGAACVPVVVENHTKDVGFFRPLERFARWLKEVPEVEVVTARTVAENLRAGAYPVRLARG